MTIPDGFGPASEVFARNYNQWSNSHNGWNNVLGSDTVQIGSIRTRSSDSWVTDSAASATAYSCAIKVLNSVGSGLISLSFRVTRLITVPLVLTRTETLAVPFSKPQKPQDITLALSLHPGSRLVFASEMFISVEPLVSTQLLHRLPPMYIIVTMRQSSRNISWVEHHLVQLLTSSLGCSFLTYFPSHSCYTRWLRLRCVVVELLKQHDTESSI